MRWEREFAHSTPCQSRSQTLVALYNHAIRDRGYNATVHPIVVACLICIMAEAVYSSKFYIT